MKWAAAKVGMTPWTAARGIGIGSPLKAALIWTNYDPKAKTIELSVVGDGQWFRPAIAAVAAQYAFNDCGVDVVSAWTPIRNDRAIRLARLTGAAVYPIPELKKTLLVQTQSAWAASYVGGRYGFYAGLSNAAGSEGDSGSAASL